MASPPVPPRPRWRGGLRLRSGLHIVTNAVNIGLELSSSHGPDTMLLGGSMRWPGAFSLIGPATLEALSFVVMDKVFLGVCGIDPEHGATTIQPEEAAVFRTMSRRARQVIVVADSSKVGMVSPAVICGVADIDTLVTDDGISPEITQAFQHADIRVIIAK